MNNGNNVNNNNYTNLYRLPSFEEFLRGAGLSDESTQSRVHNLVATGSACFPHNILPGFHTLQRANVAEHTALSTGQEPDDVMMEDNIDASEHYSYFEGVQETLDQIEDDLFAAVNDHNGSWRSDELRCFYRNISLPNADLAQKIGSFKTEAQVEFLKRNVTRAIGLYRVLFTDTHPTHQWLGVEDQLIGFAYYLSIPSEMIQPVMSRRTVDEIRARRQELFPGNVRVNPWAILQSRVVPEGEIPTLWHVGRIIDSTTPTS